MPLVAVRKHGAVGASGMMSWRRWAWHIVHVGDPYRVSDCVPQMDMSAVVQASVVFFSAAAWDQALDRVICALVAIASAIEAQVGQAWMACCGHGAAARTRVACRGLLSDTHVWFTCCYESRPLVHLYLLFCIERGGNIVRGMQSCLCVVPCRYTHWYA